MKENFLAFSSTRLLTTISFSLALVFLVSVPVLADAPGSSLDLTDLFTSDGTLDRLLNSTLEDLNVQGLEPEDQGSIQYVQKTIRGIRFAGFAQGDDPTVPANLQTIESRITIDLWFPEQIDFSDPDTSWLFINEGLTPDQTTNTLRLKKILARKLARRGLPCAIWYERDIHPDGEGPAVDTVAHQLGYNADNHLLENGLGWMMLDDPSVDPLDIQDLRYHFRFGLCQGYLLTATFVQRYLEDFFGSQADPWTAQLKTVIAGGSKRGTAALTASGVDPRVRTVRISGSQSFNPEFSGAWSRYTTDWGECPGGQYGARSEFTNWAELHKDDHPSYYDVYVPGRCPERYAHLLILDITGTHDYINPLGSHTEFWEARDGLVGGVPDPSETAWARRIIRRVNENHGSQYTIGNVNGFDISAGLVLLWNAIRQTVFAGEMSDIHRVSLNLDGPGPWSVRVRVQGSHDPDDEQLTVFLALSDDRDFRRCTDPVITAAGPCFEGLGDDNKEAEDKFIPITPTSVVRNGEFRDLFFDPPAEMQDFGVTPILAAFVELKLEGNNPNRFGDDLWIHTEVGFKNAELYAPMTCP